jgi:AmmeMemoRadiSam system protein B
MSRIPAVANMFYPGDKGRLEDQLRAFVKPVSEPKEVLAAISPHAGYVYSGKVAGAVFSKIRIPATVVLLGPNHRGMGAQVALPSSGTWEMPLGPVSIHEDLAQAILRVSTSGVNIQDDYQAHAMEHSIEVQVPFLQLLRPDVKIVPIALSRLTLQACQEVGRAVVQGIRDYGGDVLIVASTDMTHYESRESAQEKDQLAIDRILELDPPGLYETVARHRISMCGVIPTTITLEICRALGAKKAELVQYATSGDVTGDYGQVVGYAGFIVY